MRNRSYDIIIEEGSLARIGERLKSFKSEGKIMIVTDENVARLYLSRVRESLSECGFSVFETVIAAGESSKNEGTYFGLLRAFAYAGLDRSDMVLALGGGVVGDLAGFAAATYMRGIRYIQAPTTLLAAIDSSIGGKTGIDLPEGKNLAGAFHDPEIVIADTLTFDTLPAAEWKNGLGEGIKYAILAGEDVFSSLKNGIDRRHSAEFVRRCANIKYEIVQRDPHESGERKLLNLGHTAAHAAELLSGYTLPHGSAVATGLCYITRACAKSGFIDAKECDEILDLVKQYDFPLYFDYPISTLVSAMCSDKKKSGNAVTLAVIHGIGKCGLMPVLSDRLEDFFR